MTQNAIRPAELELISKSRRAVGGVVHRRRLTGSRRVAAGLLAAVASAVALILAVATSGAAQDPEESATITSAHPEFFMTIQAATVAGTIDDAVFYRGSGESVEVPPGCWIIRSRHYGGPRIWFSVDGSRPFLNDEGHHAVCLDPGQEYVFDGGPIFTPATRFESYQLFWADENGSPLDGVVVTYRGSGIDGDIEETVVVDRGGFRRFNFGNCTTLISATHPEYEFPNNDVVGQEICSTFRHTFVGWPQGQSSSAGVVTVTVPELAEPFFDFDGNPIATQYQVAVLHPEAFVDGGGRTHTVASQRVVGPGTVEVNVPEGCSTIRTFAWRPDVLFVDTSRGYRLDEVCVAAGGTASLDVGDVAPSRMDAFNKLLIPVFAFDQAGNPVADVVATFFYPRPDLTLDQLRAFDHQADDARGQFWDSTVTDADGHALMPYHADCMVATLEAPAGYRFDTGRYHQQTGCEDETVNPPLIRDDAPAIELSGEIQDQDGEPVTLPVKVDLFDEQRTTWLGDSVSGAEGRFAFAVDPGCYRVTLIAPDGFQWPTGRWLDQAACVDAGGVQDQLIAATLTAVGGGTTALGGTVTGDAGGVVGLSVDLFTANSAGDRLTYLRSAATDSSGRFRFDLAEPGCYTLTFVADAGSVFGNGSRWLNQLHCLTSGEVVDDADARLQGDAQTGQIVGTITDSGSPVAAVQIDLFDLQADGARGVWRGAVTTDANGRYSWRVPAGACYRTVFVAPAGRTWTATGSPWSPSDLCPLEAGSTTVDGVLSPG